VRLVGLAVPLQNMNPSESPPWEQKAGEPDLWFGRFSAYRALGVERMLDRTFRAVQADQGLRGSRAGQAWTSTLRATTRICSRRTLASASSTSLGSDSSPMHSASTSGKCGLGARLVIRDLQSAEHFQGRVQMSMPFGRVVRQTPAPLIMQKRRLVGHDKPLGSREALLPGALRVPVAASVPSANALPEGCTRSPDGKDPCKGGQRLAALLGRLLTACLLTGLLRTTALYKFDCDLNQRCRPLQRVGGTWLGRGHPP
jgi:hypothetical protein